MGVAVDSVGNLYVTGRYRGTINFGGEPLESRALSAEMDYTGFVMSATPSGTPRWSVSLNSTIESHGFVITSAVAGGAVVAGTYRGMLQIGDTRVGDSRFGALFVASFNTTGALQWARSYELEYLAGSEEVDLAHDAMGNLYLAIRFSGTVNFGGADLRNNAVAGESDVFLFSLTPSGTHRWSRREGRTAVREPVHLAADATGNIYASCVERAYSILDSFTSLGEDRWHREYGSPGTSPTNDVAVDSAGRVLYASTFDGSVTIGTTTLAAPRDLQSAFVAYLNPDGTVRWARLVGERSVTAVFTDARGGLYTLANDLLSLSDTGADRWSRPVFNGSPEFALTAGAVDTTSAVTLVGARWNSVWITRHSGD